MRRGKSRQKRRETGEEGCCPRALVIMQGYLGEKNVHGGTWGKNETDVE